MTLAEFLTARIAEDEAAAQVEQYETTTYDDLARGARTFVPGPETNVNRRALAECEAKRRIVELHKSGDAWCDHCAGWYGPDPAAGCPTLKLLALPYVGHEAFRDEWRA